MTIERTSDHTHSDLRSRLEAMQDIRSILPTTRGNGKRRALAAVADSLERGDIDSATMASREDLDENLPDADYVGTSIPELAASEALTEQLVVFTRAGFNFFDSSASYRRKSLSDRREAGGNGEVRRLIRSEDSLLMETPRLVIRFSAETKANHRNAVLKQHNLIHIRDIGFANAVQCASLDMPALDACLELLDHEAVEYAEPDFIEAVPQRFNPNDPDMNLQWHHTVLADPDAWDIVRGDPVRIAVIDNGFDINHPDLNIEKDLSGWFRSTANADDADFVHDLTHMPDRNHGTACAGMAAAIGDNGSGGAGVAFGASLSVVACLSDQVGTQLTLARTLAYAVQPALENNASPKSAADVISCSLGPNGARWQMRRVLKDAIEFVAANGRNGLGVPIFWASTNGNFPISADEVCAHKNTIVVGRSTATDTDDSSGYGPELDFLAPGVNVWIPASGGGYHFTTGTSFAAPCAAGVAALLLARNGSLTANEVRVALRDNADKIGPLPYDGHGRNDRFGYGRINSLRTVS